VKQLLFSILLISSFSTLLIAKDTKQAVDSNTTKKTQSAFMQKYMKKKQKLKEEQEIGKSLDKLINVVDKDK